VEQPRPKIVSPHRLISVSSEQCIHWTDNGELTRRDVLGVGICQRSSVREVIAHTRPPEVDVDVAEAVTYANDRRVLSKLHASPGSLEINTSPASGGSTCRVTR
jgi:hypothetical protein